jgi:lysophospholipase L1-like esterase
MTWHAKALTTSYVTAPRAGSHGREENDAAFPFTTTSWYFLDAVDVVAAEDVVVVACFGDSITDGTASTLNGDDRWPDVLSRRLHEQYGARVSVVNAGIGGNRVASPARYSAAIPVAGGPSAVERFDRDVAALPGVSAVIWLEGINDLSGGAKADAVIAGRREVVARGRARDLKMFGGTIVSSLGSATAHGTPEADVERQAINAFIRSAGAFDGVVDFDLATRDPQTGGLRGAFQPNSTTGGPGDRLHPNRAGYLAMGSVVDLDLFAPLFRRR